MREIILVPFLKNKRKNTRLYTYNFKTTNLVIRVNGLTVKKHAIYY